MVAKKAKAARAELGDRFASGRRKGRAICRKTGMDWDDYLFIVAEIGEPAKRTKVRWVSEAEEVLLDGGCTRSEIEAIDWATFIAQMIAMIQQMLEQCQQKKT